MPRPTRLGRALARPLRSILVARGACRSWGLVHHAASGRRDDRVGVAEYDRAHGVGDRAQSRWWARARGGEEGSATIDERTGRDGHRGDLVLVTRILARANRRV